jgi:transmembrane sensor
MTGTLSPAMPLSSSLPQTDAREQAALWVARRNNGEHNAEEQRAFLVWINASTDNREAYADAEALWEDLRGLDTVADKQLSEARAYLARQYRRPVLRRLAIAAGVLLVAGFVWQIDPLSHLNDQTHRTAQGQIMTIDLADGSRLELDTDSEARVHYSRHGREIRLARGRAAFTVAHGDSRSFEVFAGEGKIRDIGTQFDVRQLADGVVVAVLDGEVEVVGRATAAPMRLRRGQQISYSANGEVGPLQVVDIDAYTAWREGKLVFRARPLREVLEELGRYQPAHLTVTAPGMLDTQVSGVFPTDNLPQAMQTIAATLPVRLTRTGERAWQIDPR